MTPVRAPPPGRAGYGCSHRPLVGRVRPTRPGPFPYPYALPGGARTKPTNYFVPAPGGARTKPTSYTAGRRSSTRRPARTQPPRARGVLRVRAA